MATNPNAPVLPEASTNTESDSIENSSQTVLPASGGPNMSRRDFLRSSALSLAAAALFPVSGIQNLLNGLWSDRLDAHAKALELPDDVHVEVPFVGQGWNQCGPAS